ncbi:MAG TPA: hypothetical protein PKC89_14555 [Pyrinomonadaceae bacterium]|nr:hypothetical protein [Pyrinomonadaceae bacterium]
MSYRRLEFIFYLAGLLLAAAFVYFYRSDDPDWTFSAFILACSMFFLGYRCRLKERINARPTPKERSDPPDEPQHT